MQSAFEKKLQKHALDAYQFAIPAAIPQKLPLKINSKSTLVSSPSNTTSIDKQNSNMIVVQHSFLLLHIPQVQTSSGRKTQTYSLCNMVLASKGIDKQREGRSLQPCSKGKGSAALLERERGGSRAARKRTYKYYY